MRELTLILFERLCLLLVIAFVLTRTRGFRSLLYREFNMKMIIVHSIVFGIFGIVATMAGIVIDPQHGVLYSYVLSVEDSQYVVSLSLVPMVIAGLFGGPFVGLGAGIVSGAHLFLLGGMGSLADMIVNPLTGMLAGFTARFFSQERVISPFKALFIGVFPPILQMQLLLIFDATGEEAVSIVDTVGLPLVLSNALAIAIFTAMIALVLKEQENEAAQATKQALELVEEALPFMKKETEQEMAQGIANLLHERLDLAAVSIANQNEMLAYRGIEGSAPRYAFVEKSNLSSEVQETKTMQTAYSKSDMPYDSDDCPYGAAIMIPVIEAEEVVWLITFYFAKAQHIRPVETTLAEGLGQLMSHQLTTIAAERLTAHIRDAELRNLQAQINPHFLFNTLHLIASMSREDPAKARHITIQLAHFMRFNLRIVSKSLVDLNKEMEHVHAYTSIIRERFSGRLKVIFNYPEPLPELELPPSTIQPLIENCIQHGLKNKFTEGMVWVNIQCIEKQWLIVVRDNGCGFSEEVLEIVTKKPINLDSNGGNGLYNVNKRLTSLLGKSAALHIRNLEGKGGEVFFYVPMKPSNREGGSHDSSNDC